MKNRDRQDFDEESFREERTYGPYWYSWLWHFLRPALIFICALVVVIGIATGVWGYIDGHYFQPVGAGDETPVAFTVKSGDSLTRVANNLESAGLIRNRTVFKYYADFLGYGQKIQSGDYTLTKSMSVSQIADLLTTGDGNPLTRNITVIPGWTVEDIAAYLVSLGALNDSAEFLSLCKSGENYRAYYYVTDVLSSANLSQRRYALEGYLAPDTYEVYTDATADDLIKKLLSQTEAVFSDNDHERLDTLNMTMDQVLTLASMIEKEGKTADFTKVSAVFHNRLKQNMTLGSDVTVKYASGVKRMSLTNADLQFASPYNTYLYKGLPLGPICSPSRAAVQAALYPDEEYVAQNYLYFCSKDPDTGELHFSRTLEEHNLAVSIYAPLWQAYDQKQGN